MSVRQGNNVIAGGIEIDNTPTSSSYNAVSSGGVYTALSNKVDVGHQVIDYQEPTSSNNYTWYRKYVDGWVEQGGLTTNNTDSVTLPIVMADANYTVIRTQAESTNQQSYYPIWVAGYKQKTTTGFTFANASTSGKNIWIVFGMAA